MHCESLPSPLEILRRRGSEYAPDQRAEGEPMVAEAFEGGGNSGSNGNTIASMFGRALGNPDCRTGVSIGNILAAARTTGQEEVALKGFEENADRGMKFIEIKLPGRTLSIPRMDLNVLGEILRDERGGLDIETLIKSPIPVYAGLTKVSRGLSPKIIDLTDEEQVPPERIIDVLLWSVTIPGVAGARLPSRLPRDKDNILGEGKDTVFIDGGLSIKSAVDTAVNHLNCTEVVDYASNPYKEADYDQNDLRLGFKRFFGALMAPYNRNAYSEICRIVDDQVSSRQDFSEGLFRYQDKANVYGIFPPPSPELATIFTGCSDVTRRSVEICEEWCRGVLAEFGIEPPRNLIFN